MEAIVPRMRPEHWKAYGSSNFQNYISFGAIPSDKATIMLLIDHLDLATGKFMFKDSQTGNNQAYTFDLGWVQRHTRFKDEGEKPEGNRDTENRIWRTYFNEKQRSTYFSKKQLESYKTGRDYLEALLDKLVDSQKKSVVSDFVMLQILYQLTMIWTPTARMNAPRHMMKYMTGIDVVDHLPWATLIYTELWDSLKAVKISKKELTYISGCAPLLSLWYYEITNIKEPAIVNDSKPPMTNWTLEGKKVGSLRYATIMKKSETAIHILPERDVSRYIHEEIKQEPTRMKAKRVKKVEKEDGSQSADPLTEAYDKLSMLNQAYEQALVALGADTMAIKADVEKKFAQQKEGREIKDEEPQLEGKDEAEKEEDKGTSMEEVKDDAAVEGTEEECEGKKVTEEEAEEAEKKKGRKRRRKAKDDETLNEFVQEIRAKSQRKTKKPKFLESPFQTVIPKKRGKGKKAVVVVEGDDDKRDKEEEKGTTVEGLWRREKSGEEKKLLGMLNVGIPSPQDFDIRIPGDVEEGFYHNFTVQDIPDLSDDENKWLQHFLKLKVDKKRTVYEIDTDLINRYDMLQLLRGGRLKDETVEALIASLKGWLKLPENAELERKFAIITSYFSIWMLTASNLDEKNVYKKYIKKHIDGGKSVLIFPICHADHWHVLEVNLGQKICRHYSSAGHETWAADVLRIQLFLDRMVSGFDQTSTFRAFDYEAVPCHLQKGSHDCGIHVYFYIKAMLEGREAVNIEALQWESATLRARLAAQFICEGREWKKLRLKLDVDDPEYLLYFGGNDLPLLEWKY